MHGKARSPAKAMERKWSAKELAAAILLSKDELTDPEIAAKVGTTYRKAGAGKRRREFQDTIAVKSCCSS